MSYSRKKPIIYRPDSDLREPVRFIHKLWIGLVSSREVAWKLLTRNIKSQYRQTVMGYCWAVVPPVITTLTFVILRAQNVISGNFSVPYWVYVLSGSVMWQGFADALSSPLQTFNSARPILAKVNLPREAVFLSGCGETLFHFTIRFLLMSLVLGSFSPIGPKLILNLPLALLAIIPILMLGWSLGLLLVPVGLLYKDVEMGLSPLSTLWFFMTPVVYQAPTGDFWSGVLKLNPVTPLLTTAREILLGQSLSRLTLFVTVVLIIFGLSLAAWMIFRLSMPHLIKRMSA